MEKTQWKRRRRNEQFLFAVQVSRTCITDKFVLQLYGLLQSNLYYSNVVAHCFLNSYLN
jgi:hypothetical protein